MAATDEVLVRQCHQGDRDAFAEIVRRYQRLVCSVAYGATGNLGISEEVAQDAFVSAWQSLADLREPTKVRQWLCGIVRNLAHNRVRRDHRDLLSRAGAIPQASVTDTAANDPAEGTIAQEEAELLDRTLAGLPEQYREPLVLFHREGESVARVAELLDLSPEAVKQRLSRGRKLLREEVAAVVERGLRHSTPGRQFTLGVLFALPAMSGSAKAATMTIASAHGAGAAKAAGWMGISGAVLGPIAGLLGGWFGFKMSLKSARSDRERAFLKRMGLLMVAIMAAFSVGLFCLIWKGGDWAALHPGTLAVGIVTITVGYVGMLLFSIVWTNRRLAQIRREDGTVDLDPAEVARKLPAAIRRFQYPRIYESQARLLGLPLVSIRFSGASAIGRKRRPAVGWIAIGDCAYGILFAAGSIAVGGVATGAIGVGLISIGGLAIGAFALGGGAVGWWALGGLGIGWLAWGGLAVAGQAAMGGMAVAREFALGGLALGLHANDDVAKAFFSEHWFFRHSELIMSPWFGWVVAVVAIAPLLIASRFTPIVKDNANDTTAPPSSARDEHQ